MKRPLCVLHGFVTLLASIVLFFQLFFRLFFAVLIDAERLVIPQIVSPLQFVQLLGHKLLRRTFVLLTDRLEPGKDVSMVQ
jgi:hypothetical protein